ncbi:MAG: methionine biosynthesis protein MetW [Rickettsiales bacterium]|jgi:methionine biosynthesis protein MetW|nr:methionine biosynthesis protein MetW [Rickettsiales bacterium]
MTFLRADLKAVASLVPMGASVIDVGCGEGDLLDWLEKQKNVSGRGIEINQQRVNRAIARGLSVIQGDANHDLTYYPTQAYDYAVLSQTLQTLENPKEVLEQLVRIARHAIVSVPNFGHWKNRFYLLFKGRMPVTKTLSYQWYDTPNIHFCTISDFISLCESLELTIEQRLYVSHQGVPMRFYRHGLLANCFGEQGVFMIRK